MGGFLRYISVIRMKLRVLLLGIMTLFLVAALGSGLLDSRWLLRKLYPIYYADIVTRYCTRYDVDPLLVMAIMKVESGFYPRAESRRGAKGLMQIMPETAAWVASQLGLERPGEEELFDPETNIMLGTWYISSLAREFGGELVVILAAYNAGRGNVTRWLGESRWSGRVEHIEDIPFRETQGYVKRVAKTYQIYKRAYGDAGLRKTRM